MSQTVNLHSQSIAKLEAQVGQIANTLNRREEGKLPSQPVANPKGLLIWSKFKLLPHCEVEHW
jgi:hypothetical protein